MTKSPLKIIDFAVTALVCGLIAGFGLMTVGAILRILFSLVAGGWRVCGNLFGL